MESRTDEPAYRDVLEHYPQRVFFEQLSEKAERPPLKQTRYSTGYDLATIENALLWPHQTRLLRTGIVLRQMPGQLLDVTIRPRSSLLRRGLIVPVGTIDPDYEEEILIPIQNNTFWFRRIKAGERLAQIVLPPKTLFCLWAGDYNYPPIVYPPSDLTRNGGFGSTGRAFGRPR